MRIMTVEWGALSLGMCQQAKEVVNIGNAMNNEGVTLLSRIASAKLNSKEWHWKLCEIITQGGVMRSWVSAAHLSYTYMCNDN